MKWSLFSSKKNDEQARLGALRLIACDLDGTLLNEDGDVFMSTAELMSDLQARGIAVVLATGRSVQSALDVHRLLKLTAPIVALDGAVVCTADGTITSEQFLSAEQRRHMQTLCGDLDVHVTAICSTAHCSYGLPYAPEHTQHVDIELHAVDVMDDVFQYPALRYYVTGKQGIISTLSQRIKAAQQMEGLLPSTRESRRTAGMNILELRDKQVDKGSALRSVQLALGVADNEVAVIGDYRNDIPMFRKGYYGVALANAVAELKAVADFVCADEAADGGIDEFLERVKRALEESRT